MHDQNFNKWRCGYDKDENLDKSSAVTSSGYFPRSKFKVGLEDVLMVYFMHIRPTLLKESGCLVVTRLLLSPFKTLIFIHGDFFFFFALTLTFKGLYSNIIYLYY